MTNSLRTGTYPIEIVDLPIKIDVIIYSYVSLQRVYRLTNVGKTITNHPFGNGLYMFIPPKTS